MPVKVRIGHAENPQHFVDFHTTKPTCLNNNGSQALMAVQALMDVLSVPQGGAPPYRAYHTIPYHTVLLNPSVEDVQAVLQQAQPFTCSMFKGISCDS